MQLVEKKQVAAYPKHHVLIIIVHVAATFPEVSLGIREARRQCTVGCVVLCRAINTNDN